MYRSQRISSPLDIAAAKYCSSELNAIEAIRPSGKVCLNLISPVLKSMTNTVLIGSGYMSHVPMSPSPLWGSIAQEHDIAR